MRVPASMYANHRSFRTLPGCGEDGVLGCGFMTKPGGWDPHAAARGAYSAVLILRGRGWYADCSGRRWQLGPGSLFQRFAGVAHTLHIEDNPAWAECWIHLGAALETMLVSLRILDRSRPVTDPGIDPALVHELWRSVDALESAADRSLPQHLVRLQGLLLSMLGTDGQSGAADFDADRACRLLADDPRVDLRLVAHEVGLPYARFRKAFRSAVGMGPGEYRLRRRLDRARAALLEGARPIAAIAADLGYANPFTFTALFRKHVGVSPNAWRRGARAR